MREVSINGLSRMVEQLTRNLQEIEALIAWLSNLEVKCSIPGIEPDDLQVTLNGQVLLVERKGAKTLAIKESPPRKTDLIGVCAHIKTIAELALKMADRDENILLHGESGAGKSFLALYIHSSGKRNGERFVRIPATSVLDDNEFNKLAKYTGKGTLYITNLEDLDHQSQERFEKKIDQSAIENSFRIISGTCKDIDLLVSTGAFRESLKHVLAPCCIPLPPLKERQSDILLFAHYFLPILCAKNGKRKKEMSPEYLDQLELYSWPGNIRELINTLEHSIYSAGGNPTLFSKNLPVNIRIETNRKAAEKKGGL